MNNFESVPEILNHSPEVPQLNLFSIMSEKTTQLPKDLDTYPTSNADRNADNLRLADLNKKLPENSFSSVMLKDMQALGLDNVDIWYGSHVQLNGTNGASGDGGALYRKWSQLPGIFPRESSHAHKGQEYQIRTGSKNSALLFGCTPEGNTFFQTEHNFAGGPEHGEDYDLYKLLKQNIGAEGISPHTDKNPLILAPPKAEHPLV